MAHLPMPKSKSVFFKLWGDRIFHQSERNTKLKEQDLVTKKSPVNNQKFFIALQNGGVWLS